MENRSLTIKFIVDEESGKFSTTTQIENMNVLEILGLSTMAKDVFEQLVDSFEDEQIEEEK